MSGCNSLALVAFILRQVGLAHQVWRASVPPRFTKTARIAHLEERLARIEAENRLLRSRLSRVPAKRRSYYLRHERLDILNHAARYGISVKRLAYIFLLNKSTIARWITRFAEGDERFFRVEFRGRTTALVRALIHRLRSEWPSWGTRRIAAMLLKLGLEVSRSTVQRELRRRPPVQPDSSPIVSQESRLLLAKRPNHIWMLDFTRLKGQLIKTWVGAAIDIYSRRILAIASIRKAPTAAFACRLLRSVVKKHGTPTWLVTDKDPVLRRAKNVNGLLRRHGIRRRYGAVGRKGSIAIIERFWRSAKSEYVDDLSSIASIRRLDRDLDAYATWFNHHRPHQGLGNATPQEVFTGLSHLPRTPTDAAVLRIGFVVGDPRLPVLSLQRAA